MDTFSQLIGIIGIRDLREWMGLIIMYFVLGPSTVPLFWLPISMLIMFGLMAPLFYFNPPSKLNTNVLGHDPITPEAHEEVARSVLRTFGRTGNSTATESFVEPVNLTSINHQTPSQSKPQVNFSESTFVESCLERWTCQVARFYRDNPVSQWLINRFNATKVEWARSWNDGRNANYYNLSFSLHEDCAAKYKCSIISPNIRKFISIWTSKNI